MRGLVLRAVMGLVLGGSLGACNSILGIGDVKQGPQSDAAVTDAAPGLCTPEAVRCSSPTQPQTCDPTGQMWVDDPPCGGSTPICNNGVCANQLLRGGLTHVQISNFGLSSSMPALREAGFSVPEKTCDSTGTKCVVGGI
jgi:hypothetical protein